MKITMYEVNFGEAIVYEDGNELLLVDCGAYFRDNSNARAGMVAYSKVKNILNKDKVKKLMITHFDRDHFNGVNEMQGEKFQYIYLPYYTWSEEKGKQYAGDIFEEALKVYTCSFLLNKDNKISQIKMLICKLKDLVYDVNNIKCVKVNNKVNVGTKNFTVLWPTDDGRYYKNDRSYYEELLKFLNKEFGRNLEKEVEDFCSLIKNYYLTIRDNNDNIGEKLDVLENDINITYGKLEEIAGISTIRLEEGEKRRINSINSSLIKSMNECSIVMHIENKILATGDISKKIISKLELSEQYEVIKLAHHGTKSYYYEELPEAKYFLISNSGEKRANWGIYEEYKNNYKNTEIICTNTNPVRCNCICKKCNCVVCKNSDLCICKNTGDRELIIDLGNSNDFNELYFVHGFTNLYEEVGYNENGIYRNFVTLVKYDEEYNISDIIDEPIYKIVDNLNEGDFVYYNGDIRSAENDERVLNYKNMSREIINSINYEEHIPENTFNLEVDDVVSYHINVGHGNCSIIVFGNKNTNKYDMWLIDCSVYDFRNRISYKEKLNKCLLHIKEQYGVRYFSKVLITHHHFDHINGLDYLIENGYIKSETEIWLNISYFWTGKKYIKIIEKLKDISVKFIEPICDNSLNNIEILYPQKRIRNKNGAPGKYINNISVVYKINFMNKSMLFMGDLEEEGLSEIQNCFPHLKVVDYYCVSHHGSINGHSRKKCPCSSKSMIMSECACDTRIQILMGRDNAYPGIFSKEVINSYNNLIITSNCDNYYEINWLDDKISKY